MCGSAGVAGQLQARTPSRVHCVDKSCDFYSNCIESAFPCGHQGFVFSYAERRCRVISMLRKRDPARCEKCVGAEAFNWAHRTESCFKRKLEGLLQRYSSNVHPDPQTCLNWEADAIAEMNSCYVEGDLENALRAIPDQIITRLVNLFRMDASYYNSTVDTGLVEHIKNKKSSSLAPTLLSNVTLTTRHRIIICIQGSKYVGGLGEDHVEPSPEEFVNVTIHEVGSFFKLRPDRQNFHYAGPDMEDVCLRPGLVNEFLSEYHIVTWFTNNNSLRDIGRVNSFYDQEVRVNAILFELTTREANSTNPRKLTRCGDGIRQVSEYCDFAGTYPGCTIDCKVMEGYDCSTGKLEPSKCWVEECGDGRRTRSEQCDDGNDMGGDGCSNTTCQVEPAHICSRVYNRTSHCRSIPLTARQTRSVPSKLTSQSASYINTPKHASAQAGKPVKRTVEIAPVISGTHRPLPLWSSWLPLLLALVCVCVLR